jgi:hypothetical protein
MTVPIGISRERFQYGCWFYPNEEVIKNVSVKVALLNEVMKFHITGLNDVLLFNHSFMELSPSWEAANFAATQELPSSLWNPKVHFCVHKSSPQVPTLSQINPIHTIPSYFSKINFILSSRLRLGLPDGLLRFTIMFTNVQFHAFMLSS